MSVKLGIDLLEQYSYLLNDKRLGLITNATGINFNFENTIDLIHKNFNLVKLFAPEHGVRSDLQAGVKLDSYTDKKTGIPVVSLYGKSKKFTKEMVEDIDLVLYDIQDVGARFYTYLYTLAYAMEACKKYNKKCIVFDRPNPLNSNEVEGNILDPAYKSFIGLYPITQRYGLTIGECARLFNKEFGIDCDLEVIKMSDYKRHMYYQNTGVNWVLPSPNIPTPDTCLTFASSCIFEGTNISEGRGTTKPFSFVGAPWLDAIDLAKEMNDHNLPGVHYRPHYFTPTFSKHQDVLCNGVEIHVIDKYLFKPIKSGLVLLYVIKDLCGDKFEFLPPYHEKGKPMIDYNTGNSYVRDGKLKLHEVLDIYIKDTTQFISTKSKYHIY